MSISPMGLDNPADKIDAGASKAPEEIAGRSPWQLAMEQLRSDKVAMICLGILVFFVLVALFSPLLSRAFGVTIDTPEANILLSTTGFDGMPVVGPPYNGFIWAHPLGIAPSTGTDNLAFWMYGARTSMGIALVSTVAATIIGITMGLVAGFARGPLEAVISWIIDFFLSLPFILVALSVAPILVSRFSTQPALLSASQLVALLLVLSLTGWMALARLIRGEVLSLREREFVLSARAIGVPTRSILRKELLPNLIAPIIVSFSLGLPAFVSAEAGLAYLGIGVTNIPSWGRTINAASNYYDTYPLYLWAPVAGVLTLVVALNLLGDSIRDAFDPKTRR
ncbi:MAG: ABC transporter permease [Nocardioidaceae bacterium]